MSKLIIRPDGRWFDYSREQEFGKHEIAYTKDSVEELLRLQREECVSQWLKNKPTTRQSTSGERNAIRNAKLNF